MHLIFENEFLYKYFIEITKLYQKYKTYGIQTNITLEINIFQASGLEVSNSESKVISIPNFICNEFKF